MIYIDDILLTSNIYQEIYIRWHAFKHITAVYIIPKPILTTEKFHHTNGWDIFPFIGALTLVIQLSLYDT